MMARSQQNITSLFILACLTFCYNVNNNILSCWAFLPSTLTTNRLQLMLPTVSSSFCRDQQVQRQRQRRLGQHSPLSTRLFYRSSDRTNRKNNNHDDSYDKEDGQEEDLNNHPFNRRRQQEEQEAVAFRRHMEQVRWLQRSFYTTSTSFMDNPNQATCQLQSSTGRLLQLPLWRDAQWYVPGRSNVLEISDPVYTHMFESILYKPQPWCFGHLYLQPQDQQQAQLHIWKDLSTSSDAVVSPSSTSSSSTAAAPAPAVLGCLMHIADFRRMADGRLLLLVHALERFVVTDIVRQLPYAIVHAQILPDTEEIDPLLLDVLHHPGITENTLREPRAMAVLESVNFHPYEYDPHHSFSTISSSRHHHHHHHHQSQRQQQDHPDRRLAVGDRNNSNLMLPPSFLPPPSQLPLEENLSLADIAKVLPFCPFSKISIQEAQSTNIIVTTTSTSTTTRNNNAKVTMSSKPARNDDTSTDSMVVNTTPTTDQQDEPSLEYQLLQRGILQVPPMDPDFFLATTSSSSSTPSPSSSSVSSSHLSIEMLERDLWLAMNYFLVTTKWPVSPILLSLLPPLQPQDEMWPDGFVLYKIANDLTQLETMDHDFVAVSSDYPSYRRQRRLSFSAAYLLEDYYQHSNNKKWANTHAKPSLQKKLLLSIPSTKQRLRVVLERFLQWQHQHWGEFQ
jgi:hypothetical protein